MSRPGLWAVPLLVLAGAGCDDATAPAAARPAGGAVGEAATRCEHGLPAHLCTRCNPALAAVFQAKGDWCAEHGFPESFCPLCNPDAPVPQVDAPAPAADWCGGHGLPESMCTRCNPDLIARFQAAGDWCAEHGFPESACPVCNPRPSPGTPVADWCLEHGLPESMCTKCNPELAARFQAAGDWCVEHGFPESVCPVCNPQPAPAGAEVAALEARVVRLASPGLETAVGLETAPVGAGAAGRTVTCTARIAFDADRVADVRAVVPGVVRRMPVTLGQRVERGTPLFELESPRVSELQAARRTALERVRVAEAAVARERALLADGITSARQAELAEQEVASARAEARAAEAALRVTGAADSAPSGRYTLSAPLAGTVVRRPAVVGQLATASESLATVADTSVMWALCDVPESAVHRVRVGHPVRVTVGGEELTGEITWVAAEVDPRTRTVSARAEVPNPEGRLRANQFAQAHIQAEEQATGVSVPRSAVQRVGDREVVFVRTGPGVYAPRVVVRRGEGDPVGVEGRVLPGEAVVTTGAVLLRTEILPGSIGAGCCETEPPGAD